jgi:RNA polymerase sigma-70 factor (ECF subfamily)
MTEGPATRAVVARLLTRHHTALYGYVYACVRSHHDAEDILQSVAVTVTESFGQLRDEAGFLPWAREIARRHVLAFWRKSRRETPHDPEVARRLAEAADVLDRARPASDHADALSACLESLPPESRRLLALRYGDDHADAAAVANQLGRSVQAVYSLLKRIKTILRSCVERRLAAEKNS